MDGECCQWDLDLRHRTFVLNALSKLPVNLDYLSTALYYYFVFLFIVVRPNTVVSDVAQLYRTCLDHRARPSHLPLPAARVSVRLFVLFFLRLYS